MNYTQLILRIGLGIVFFWFGIDKFLNPEFWQSFIPEYIISLLPISINLFLYLQGFIESIIGLFIIIGLFTKLMSFLAALILLVIIISLGINDIAIRDIGLLSIAITLIFTGGGDLSLDNKIKLRK